MHYKTRDVHCKFMFLLCFLWDWNPLICDDVFSWNTFTLYNIFVGLESMLEQSKWI